MAATLSDESRHTVRQVGALTLQRAVQIAAGVLYVTLIPRVMGPEVFGQFVTLQTLSMWISMIGGLGAIALMTRYVPEFVARGDRVGLRKLASSLLTLRLINGLVGALLYFVVVQLWLRDLDRTAIALVAVTITLRTAANLPFALLLGLNQLSQWGAGELLRGLLLFPLIYTGVQMAGLRGACAALVVTEGSVLALGLWWSRGFVARPSLPLDRQFLKPFLQFSALFFGSNVMLALFEQGGTAFVRLISGNYAEAGYYGIAFGGYLAGAGALWKLLSGFGPLFSALQIKGDTAELQVWIGRLLRVLAVCGVAVTGFLYGCADLLVEWMLGRGYEPVAALLPWLAVTGLAAGPGNIARVLAMSFGQGRIPLVGAAAQLTCFATVSWILIPGMGSVGGCIGVAAATSLFSVYATWRIRDSIPYSLRSWAGVVILGAACSPVLWAWNGFGPLRFALFLALFGAGAIMLGFVRMSEARMLWHVLRSAPPVNR